MPLKLAAVVPHPPLLIPSVGKENNLLLEKTKNSYKKLEERLREEKIETIIIFSSHGAINPRIFGINIAPEFEINFEAFGDYTSKIKIPGDMELAQNIREALYENEQVRAISEPLLDHGSGVPLFTLCQNIKKIEVVPLSACALPIKDHFALGRTIGRTISGLRKKIAVFASGDLSHCLAKNAPAGYSPRGAKFDQRLIELLQEKKIEEILNIDESLVADAKPCGLKSIAMLLGCLSEMEFSLETFTYESPFGVGYLTAIINPD